MLIPALCVYMRAASPRAALVVGTLFAMASIVHADCGRTTTRVVGTEIEREEACVAIDEVLSYFASAGLEPHFEVTVRFQPTVKLSAVGGATLELPQVSGYYDAQRREVRMTSLDSTWISQRKPWGLPWNRSLGLSILQHEITHALVNQHLGEGTSKLPSAWHEALAYAVQLDLMAPDLRAAVLARYPSKEAFESTLEINDFIYGVDPDGFAISAYKTYVREGRQAFIRRALKFGYDMIDVRDLF